MLDTATHELALEAGSDAVSRSRRFLAEVFAGEPDGLLADAQLAVTELVTNAVLHGAPPMLLRAQRTPDGVRLEVYDAGPRPPVRIRDPGQSMTGRGLALVAALSTSWGVRQENGGKVVWAEVPRDSTAVEGLASSWDVAEVLASWQSATDADQLFTVELGDVPTDLLLEAKSHVDNLVREFILAAGNEGEQPDWLTSLVESVVHDFATARTQIKEQAIAAASRHVPLTHLVLRLPASAALAGERYLAALDEADRYARNARLLTLEAPPVHKVFRRWYVEALIDQLRTQVMGEHPRRVPVFAERLAEEYTRLAPLQQTATRLSMIQKVTADLAAAATVQEVAETVVQNALDLLLADMAVVYLLGDDGLLHAVQRKGNGDDALAERFDSFPLSADLPGSIALRTGEALVFRSRSDFESQFPDLTSDWPEEMRLLVAPLVVGEHRLGVMAMRFLGATTVDEESQLSMLRTLAGVTSQALERAFATSRAADSAQRLALLAEASVVLSSSLEHRAVLQALADVVVPRLADWCAIQLLEGDQLVNVGITHSDPARTDWARALEDRYPVDMTAQTGAPAVIRSGISELYVEIPPELLHTAAVDEEHLKILQELGMTSALVVPLRGHRGVIGAITLIYAESGRRYTTEDVALAEDLARRAGVAVETADAFLEQTTRLEDVRRVAEAAQHAILAQPPAQVGAYALGAHYVSAAAEALVGGDLYEITEREGAVRLLIGDVRGKGLEAVRVATVVLGEFRAAAADLDDLTTVARQIDRRLGHYLSEEEFVTALVVDLNDDGTYTLVNCGHPCPLLASGRTVREIDCHPTLPLGLGVEPVATRGTLRPHDRLLLFTDGLVEARDAQGTFVDLFTVTAPLRKAPLEDVLDEILASVQTVTGGPLGDDLALLVAEYRPS